MPHSPIGNTLGKVTIVTRPKTARYDVYTLIKIGIDRQSLLQLCPNVCKKSSVAKQVKKWSRAYCTAART